MDQTGQEGLDQSLSPSAKTDQGDSECLKLETGHQVSTPEELCLTTSCARLNGDEVFSAFVFGLELAVALVMAYFVFALLGAGPFWGERGHS